MSSSPKGTKYILQKKDVKKSTAHYFAIYIVTFFIFGFDRLTVINYISF